jgi:ABC-type glycerol-3-phosphate transport system permease component
VTITSDRFTLPAGLAMFRYELRVEWILLMDGTVLIALPTLVIFPIFQRLFIQGIATSGLRAYPNRLKKPFDKLRANGLLG